MTSLNGTAGRRMLLLQASEARAEPVTVIVEAPADSVIRVKEVAVLRALDNLLACQTKLTQHRGPIHPPWSVPASADEARREKHLIRRQDQATCHQTAGHLGDVG